MAKEFPLDWEELREGRLERDGECCAECGREAPLWVAPVEGDGWEMGDLRTVCERHCPVEWQVAGAKVVWADEDDEDAVMGDASEGDDAGSGGIRAWLRGALTVDRDLGAARYPDMGGYQGFVYARDVTRWSVGVAVLTMVLGVLWFAGGVAVTNLLGREAGEVWAMPVAVLLGSPVEAGLGWFGLVYLGYLVRRDYGDAHWPRVRWVPVDRAVVRRHVEAVLLTGVGMLVLALEAGGVVEGLVWRAGGEVVFLVGLGLLVVRTNYVVVRGVLFDELDVRAFAWEWVLRMGFVVAVLDLSVGTVVPFAVVVGMPVAVGALFAVVAWRQRVPWTPPRGRGEAGKVGRARARLYRLGRGARRPFDVVGDYVERVRENERRGD